MTIPQHVPTQVIGFDVAKDSITVFDSLTGRPHGIANEAAAIRAFIRTARPGCLAVCEPTGGHETVLLRCLMARGIAVHRVDTLKLKAFMRSFGTIAKTDAIDARALARYGQDRWAELPLFEPPNAAQAELSALVARRRDLTTLKTAETNRLKAPAAKTVQASCKALLRSIEAQIARIDRAIDDIVQASPELTARIRIAKTLPGVGERTAIALAATMPELGTLSRRQAAGLAGVAPHPNDSGTIRGYRKMRGGRTNVRNILFMAALAASRANGPLKKKYQNLIANGKKPIVAIAALMRNIIVILNAKIRDHLQQQS